MYPSLLWSTYFGITAMKIGKYPLDEHVTILEARARWGLSETAIGTQELALIDDAVAGDTRIASSILRNAVRLPDQRDYERILTELVHDAVPEVRDEVR